MNFINLCSSPIILRSTMLHKIMFRAFFLALMLLYASFTQSQTKEKNWRVGCIAFYNVENLFDTINDPTTNDEEFTPQGDVRWNTEKYVNKLKALSEAMAGIGTEFTPDGAALIGVSEIENKQVMLDLVNQPALSGRSYKVVHFDSPDRRGVDVGLIYQPKYFRPLHSKSYRLIVENNPDFLTRDPLVVTGLFDGEEISVIVNHWPSRRGGEKRSMPLRMAAARLNRHIVDSLLGLNPDAKIVVMGDLNDNPTNKSILEGLNAKGTKDNLKTGELFNPMFSIYKKGVGSNAWQDSWSLFDQLIISQGLLGEDFSTYTFRTARVHNKTELAQKTGRFKGYPHRTYAGGTYLGGYSDHFPAYIIIAKEVK